MSAHHLVFLREICSCWSFGTVQEALQQLSEHRSCDAMCRRQSSPDCCCKRAAVSTTGKSCCPKISFLVRACNFLFAQPHGFFFGVLCRWSSAAERENQYKTVQVQHSVTGRHPYQTAGVGKHFWEVRLWYQSSPFHANITADAQKCGLRVNPTQSHSNQLWFSHNSFFDFLQPAFIYSSLIIRRAWLFEGSELCSLLKRRVFHTNRSVSHHFVLD